MSKILVIRKDNNFLTKSLLDNILAYDHEIEELEPEMKILSNIKQMPDIMMIMVESTMTEKQQALVYLRDLAIEKDIPIFLLGYPIDIEGVKGIISESSIQEVMYRPFDVKEIASRINDFLETQTSNVKKKILVVDDSGVMLRNVKNLLGEKYQVILANSGAMAIKYLAMDMPDLVLLDYEMPVINGKQVLETIRTENDFSGAPVIFLTSKNDKETIMDVMSLKPEGYLLKSMTAEAFTKAIDVFFEKRKNI